VRPVGTNLQDALKTFQSQDIHTAGSVCWRKEGCYMCSSLLLHQHRQVCSYISDCSGTTLVSNSHTVADCQFFPKSFFFSVM